MDRRWVLLSEKANLKGSHSVRFIYIMFLKWQNCRTAGKYQLLSGLGVVAGNVWCKGQHQVSVMEQFCIFIVAAKKSTHVTLHRSHTWDHWKVVKSERYLDCTASWLWHGPAVTCYHREQGGSCSASVTGLFGNFLRIYFKGKKF